jgi:NADP-dependent 3-hydroxy acid dehydrogenase YdfG
MTENEQSISTGGTTKRALVTGAASGLGRAIATRYVQAGWRVLLTDVDDEGLTLVGKDLSRVGEVATRRLDVRKDADFERARTWCEDSWGGLDLLVNNAGVASGGRMERVSMDDWEWILELNLKSVIRGCRTFVPLFKSQGSGYIANVASLAGVANLPGMSNYNVTKAAVISLSQTLRYELKPYGTGVSVVCPAFVNTNLGASMRSSDPVAVDFARRQISGATVTAEQVAEKVFEGIAKERFMILTHREGHAIRALSRVAPSLLERHIGKGWEKARLRFEQADAQAARGEVR